MSGNADKTKFSIRVDTELLKLADHYIADSTVQNRTELIEDALRFYLGFLTSRKAEDYLLQSRSSVMTSTVRDSENRIARLLFKLAVEVNMMMNVLAAGMEISDEDLKTLRARSVREVKQTNGRISFKDAIDYQRGVE